MRNIKEIIVLQLFILLSAFPLAAKPGGKDYEPFDRGIHSMSSLFMPKGTIGTGFSFSYSTFDTGKAGQDAGFVLFSRLIQNVRGDLVTLSLAPQFEYFLWNNVSLGTRFDYARTDLKLGSASFMFGDGLAFDIQDYGYFRQSYTGSFTIRDYMPIDGSRRFSLFMEGRLTGGYAQGENYKMENGLKHGVYQDIYKGRFSIVPGICIFLTNSFAFEVGIGVMGIHFQKTVQTENQVKTSQLVQSGANFHINLFSIEFGTHVYLLDKYHKLSRTARAK